MENIRAARAIKLYGREKDRHDYWQNIYADQVNNGLELDRFGIKTGIGNSLIFGALGLLIFYIAAQMVVNGNFTLGMLFAFQAYQTRFSSSCNGLISFFMSLRMLGLHQERLADIVYTEKEQENVNNSSLKALHGSISIDNISFRYDNIEPYLFKDFSLSIPQGKLVALTGPSGGGKTTLMKLMVGLLSPEKGNILIDDIDLKKIDLRQFRRQVGTVMQDDQLLSGSIADNISFFDPDMDQDRIEEAAKFAFIHDDIQFMPMGYQSLVGDMGSALSGGQKQRILLARALYIKPAILFMDEGTANLDQELEQAIVGRLLELPITRIVVAHRPALINVADMVISIPPDSSLQQIEFKKENTFIKQRDKVNKSIFDEIFV